MTNLEGLVSPLNCTQFTDRLRNVGDLIVQRTNSLRGREATIRACIADLRQQLRNCNTGQTGQCTENERIIQVQTLLRLEEVAGQLELILSEPC